MKTMFYSKPLSNMSLRVDPQYLAEAVEELRLQLNEEENRTNMWYSIAKRLATELKRQRAAMCCLQNISRMAGVCMDNVIAAFQEDSNSII